MSQQIGSMKNLEVMIRDNQISIMKSVENLCPMLENPTVPIQGIKTYFEMNPQLLDCSWTSVKDAIAKTAATGARLWMGEADIIKYGHIAQFALRAKGAIRIIRDERGAVDIVVSPVYEGEVFRYEPTAYRDKVHHIADPFRDVSDVEGYRGHYAMIEVEPGSKVYSTSFASAKLMAKIRSKAKTDNVWAEFLRDMQDKTMLKRAAKYLGIGARMIMAENDDYDFEEPIQATATVGSALDRAIQNGGNNETPTPPEAKAEQDSTQAQAANGEAEIGELWDEVANESKGRK
jgi:phage RecT family recombinase